ncbi:MAG: hypothetical protein JWR32_6422 [Mycobacterium sp.]|jgi:hypothetical protein|nr:hypothetical protein [Mycobacterium sp.]
MKLCAQFTTSRCPGEHIATARTCSAVAAHTFRRVVCMAAETHAA